MEKREENGKSSTGNVNFDSSEPGNFRDTFSSLMDPRTFVSTGCSDFFLAGIMEKSKFRKFYVVAGFAWLFLVFVTASMEPRVLSYIFVVFATNVFFLYFSLQIDVFVSTIQSREVPQGVAHCFARVTPAIYENLTTIVQPSFSPWTGEHLPSSFYFENRNSLQSLEGQLSFFFWINCKFCGALPRKIFNDVKIGEFSQNSIKKIIKIYCQFF